MRQRIDSIDILKFFAALLITNSHMGVLYPDSLVKLSTGGAIGDVLFFFCSGFTLFLGRGGDFFNWYKRRINRIYPTVLMWAVIQAFVFKVGYGMDFTVLHGGGWFVSCIMIYYVFLYFIKRYFVDRLQWVFVFAGIVVMGWYLTEDSSAIFMYGETYFKWCHYFLFMLAGAACGLRMKESRGGKLTFYSSKSCSPCCFARAVLWLAMGGRQERDDCPPASAYALAADGDCFVYVSNVPGVVVAADLSKKMGTSYRLFSLSLVFGDLSLPRLCV